MKTSVEISGYLITIEEVDGVISVNAAKDDEVVEEFTINVEESEEGFEGEEGFAGEEGDDVRPFGEYEEEDDFGSDEDDDIQDEIQDELQDEDEDDDDDDDENELEGRALESFQAFINKKK
jgi:hypothetical protein